MDHLQKVKGFLAFLGKIQVDHKTGIAVGFELEPCLFKLVKELVQGILDFSLQGNVARLHLFLQKQKHIK